MESESGIRLESDGARGDLFALEEINTVVAPAAA